MFLAAKLRFQKNKLKIWRAKEYPKEMEDMKQIKKRVQDIDLCVEQRPFTDLEINDRRTTFQKIVEMDKMAILDMKQKSRIK